MKKKIIIGLAICIGVGGIIFGTNKFKSLTEEEKMEISRNVEKNLNKNIKYRFARVISIDGSKINVNFFETPKDYDDTGYNQNLNVDTLSLKSLGERQEIQLSGVATNFNLADLKVNDYVRVGTYKPNLEDKLEEVEMNKVLWVETLQH